MRGLLIFICFLLSVAAWSGCAAGTRNVDSAAGDVHFYGTVTYQNLEGGFYGIVGEDGKKYDPLNLTPEFRQNGLEVEVTARPKEGVMTTHMWGTPVEILHIEKR